MNAIKAVRAACGLTQQQLAEKIGTTPQMISAWENGARNPKRSTLLKIAEACQRPLSVLRVEKPLSCPRDTPTELVVTCKDVDSDIGRERGWRDVWYRCPGCGVVIATESWDRVYCFGSGSIMKDNHIPAFCPECGQKIIKKRWKP